MLLQVAKYQRGESPLPIELKRHYPPNPKVEKADTLGDNIDNSKWHTIEDSLQKGDSAIRMMWLCVTNSTCAGGNYFKHHMQSVVKRDPASCFWLGQSETLAMEPGAFCLSPSTCTVITQHLYCHHPAPVLPSHHCCPTQALRRSA